MINNELVQEIKTHNWRRSWLDFSIFSYDRGCLVISASDDLSYYHTMEITLITPTFIHGVTDWSCDVNEDFINYISEKNMLSFFSDNERIFSVIADKILVNFDTVFYYPRENLTAGQRLAYWLE